MVATPWGDSATLRDRRLRPGAGVPPLQVAESQRARIFGAIVAATATKGFGATRIEDIEEISGVSARSFYELFADKETAFTEALGRLLDAAVEQVSSVRGSGTWESERVERLHVLARAVEDQAPAARMCLIEAYVAGAGSTELLDAATRRAERLLHESLAESPGRAGMPPEMAVAALGAVLEILRGHLLHGSGEIEGALGPLASLLLAYRAPSGPLRSAARVPEPRPEAAEASDHAERALRAFEALLTRRPLAEVTMEQVGEEAGMSRRTLYANFADRPGLLAAAIDAGCAQLGAVATPAFRRHEVPAEGMRAAIGALLALLASRPNLAHLLLVAAQEGGRPALRRRSEGLRPLRRLLRQVPARPPGAPLGGIALEALLGGLLWLMRRRLLDSGAAGLAGLGPICTYIALAPLIGGDRATISAQGRSYRRSGPELTGLATTIEARPDSSQIPIHLADGQRRSAREVAEAFGMTEEDADDRLAELVEVGMLKAVEEEQGYQAIYPILPQREWEGMDQARRESMTAEVWQVIEAEVAEAIESGSFDARPERHLVRLPALLDAEGWREISAQLDLTLERCLEIDRRARERSDEAGGPPAAAAWIYLVSFEAAPACEDG